MDEIPKVLEELTFNINSSKFKDRRDAINHALEVSRSHDLNTNDLKSLCILLQQSLSVCLHKPTRQALELLIGALIEKYPDNFIPNFLSLLNAIAKKQKNIITTRYTSQVGLVALQWLNLLLSKGFRCSESLIHEKLTQIMEMQSILLTSVVAFGYDGFSSRAFSSLTKTWASIPQSENLYMEKLQGMEQNQQTAVLAGALIKRIKMTNDDSLIKTNLELILNCFIKSFINCKTRPEPPLIVSCYPILKEVDSDLFGKLVVSALQKTMLRNPEISLEAVNYVIAGVTIDLSPHAVAIGDSLIGSLHSNEVEVRAQAANICKNLAQKTSSTQTIKDLLTKIFNTFHGANGKLNVADQKINVLQGAGNLSYNNVNEKELDDLNNTVATHFAKVLDVEVHEKVLCHTLDMLILWGSKPRSKVPEKIISVFKVKMEAKATTVAVRTSYMQCIMAWFKNCNKEDAVPLVPILLKALERAVSQSTQPASVIEGLCASCMLLDIISEGQKIEDDKVHLLWSTVLDADKQSFTSEKFLANCGDQGLIHVMQMSGKLLLKFSDKLKSNTKSVLYRSILYCVTLGSSNSRKQCLSGLKYIVSCAKGSILARELILELETFLLNNRGTEKSAQGDGSTSEIAPKVLKECISILCLHPPQQSSEFQEFCVDLLIVAHHPLVVSVCPHFWTNFIKLNNVKPKELVAQQANILRQKFIDNYKNSNVYENIIATLVEINGDIILSPLVDTVAIRLSELRKTTVSREDYFVYLTPSDELYDKSVLHGDNIYADINMKRESKAYSYKEQLEELQLRREIEEKKRKEGKIKTPQYTPKQLEAIKNQKQKEATIRDKLTSLNVILMDCVSMVKAASRGNPSELSLYFKTLLPAILSNLHSPLSAPQMSSLFISLREIVFSGSLASIGKLVCFVTLRLLKPECSIDSSWEEEPLNKAVERAVSSLYHITVSWKTEETCQYLSAPAFCYSFCMLEHILLSSYVKHNEELMQNGLHFISYHTKMKGEGSTKNLHHPQYLPIQHLFELLMQIISKSSGRVQTQAQSCLLDVASCVNGEEGCAQVTLEEVNMLLTALQSRVVVVRDTALRALLIALKAKPTDILDNCDHRSKIAKYIWASKFDSNEENRALADKLWDTLELEFPDNLCNDLIQDLEHSEECVQLSTSKALAALLETANVDVQSIIASLLSMYNKHLQVIPAKLDEFGREVEKPIDIWYPRRGVALAIIELAPLITTDHIGELIQFFVSTTLSDRNVNVRKEMLNAALKMVDLHGKDTVSSLWPIFDNFMSKSSKSAHFDDVKQAVVILMGSLARHLEKDDPRIKPIVGRLIQALSTPSQTVQEAVANCLPHLISSVKEEASGYINKLLHQLLKGDKYGERRGAAYGLAGFVKGLGILALKQHDIMNKLIDAIQDKKNYKHREGALFAFEMLFQMLGKLFEPYIVHVLPHLLQCFGDTSQYVRTAADDTAKVVMSKLSGHGVKLVLPSLLAALEEDSWRTKTGSVELLGDMAYCAPKQLSSCLPSIVPKLIEVLSDSHMKVQEAGATALKVIGSVIRNPEIQAIVPVLLQALQDPSNKTSLCLQTLLDTQFVHFIDAPSLALIMPVVQRSFMDRSTETRKMAAQIIGNMYSLTDQKDLMPYLPTIIPGLKTSLLDPVPDVRSVSARALGAMVRGMGESSFEDLLPWLMQTLTSETSSVDRSGAAQGLSEVVGGLGVEKLHKLMPEIIATAERTDIAPHVKDGYIMMFIYMPVVFTAEFTSYIGQIINPILKALADENEYVRDTALKAGQRIVTLYADSAILLLLPELEKGLFDDNWRIRFSSVQLLGDLLYRISGVTGKMSTETASEDDNFGTEQSHLAIIRALGAERRNRVLAGLYMGRSDVALMVRQAALHVWKVVVTNTPRTLREILPTLFSLLLGCLASESYDKRQVAARTLGDLVRKLGERVLPEIIPILENGLLSDQADQRQGVCIGLSEIMASTSKEMVLTFVNSLVPTVRKALCDPLPEVRQAAAKTFDSLHTTVGSRALDEILPAMLNKLSDEDSEVAEWTLDGLRQVMAIKSRVVLPYLVPQLTAPPANTKALSILASVAGEALNKYLPRILPALQSALATARDTPEEAQQLEYCQTLVLSVVDEVGIRTVIDTLLENTRNESSAHRRAAATLLCVFCANSKAQYTAHIPQLIRGLIHLCTDSEKDVLQMSWEALNAVIKTLEPKQQATYVSDVRQSVRYAMSDLKGESELLPGFCLPKGIAPILPIFREAILNGDGDEKEAAALGLGEVIKVTSAQALQPSVVAITGPLIRILGDRFSPNVKTAVLDTLAILLSKVGVMLKQFLPQLQTTFVKSLNDPSRVVRLKSANALSHLIVIHQRPDPLFTELHNTIKNTDDIAVKETTLHALRGIVTQAGDKMAETVKLQVHNTLIGLLNSQEDTIRNCAAGCLGALCKYLTPEQVEVTLTEHLLVDDNNLDWILRQGRAAALSVALKQSADNIWKENYKTKITDALVSQLQASKVPVTQAAVRSSGYLVQYLMTNGEQIPNNILVPFVRTMNNNSNEVKQLLAKVCIHLAKSVPQEKFSSDFLKLILPTLVNGTKEKNGYVKANSEMALIAVLRLKQGDEMLEKCLTILDVGARESLSDVITKVLKKMISQPEGKEEELDDTLLT